MRRRTTALITCLVAAVALAMVAVPAAVASSRDTFEGKITKVNRDKHTFKMNDHHRGIVKIKANGQTRYEHLSGFGALHKGLKVDVKAHRNSGRWIADKIDRSSGSNGSGDGGGND